jgi:ribonuclease R
MGVGLTISDEPVPGEFQRIAEATKDRPDAQQIHTMLLRSMQQAIYTPINSGHFGLAYEAYTHFTSPIRRYPDLLVHRVIKAVLATRRNTSCRCCPPRARRRKSWRVAWPRACQAARQKPKKAGVPPTKLAWEAAGLHCSANERRADEASRDVEAWLKCKYMREHLGEEFGGVVTSATSFGIFVTLDAMYVEGLVHITELGGEYFKFDEARQELRGERTGIRYAIGTRVRVQVSRVDLDGRKIDFRLVREGEELHRAGDARQGRGARWRAGARPPSGGVPPSAGQKVAPARRTHARCASPIQALKASVKKAAAKKKGRQIPPLTDTPPLDKEHFPGAGPGQVLRSSRAQAPASAALRPWRCWAPAGASCWPGGGRAAGRCGDRKRRGRTRAGRARRCGRSGLVRALFDRHQAFGRWTCCSTTPGSMRLACRWKT